MPCLCQTLCRSTSRPRDGQLERVRVCAAAARCGAVAGCPLRAAARGRRCRATPRRTGSRRPARARGATRRSARAVGRVALVEVALEQRDVLAREEVRRRRDEVAARIVRLLLEPDDPVVGVELDHAVQRRERRVGELVHRDRAALALAAPERDVVARARTRTGCRRRSRAGRRRRARRDRSTNGCLRSRRGDPRSTSSRRRGASTSRARRPALERRRLARVRHDVHLVRPRRARRRRRRSSR